MKPLVFSMGFNGYQWLYDRNIRSQKKYCEEHGFDFLMIEKPTFTNLYMECAWFKIPALLGALQSGRPWVLYLDADIEARPGAPSFLTLEKPDRDLYLANGFSGRVNSGMILVKNTPRVQALLSETFQNALKTLPPEDDVGWGENGHIIHYAKNYPGLEIVDGRWNNNKDPELADYFRHYSAGPMRKFYHWGLREKVISKVTKSYVKHGLPTRTVQSLNFYERMDSLASSVFDAYPSEFKGRFDKIGGGLIAANG